MKKSTKVISKHISTSALVYLLGAVMLLFCFMAMMVNIKDDWDVFYVMFGWSGRQKQKSQVRSVVYSNTQGANL